MLALVALRLLGLQGGLIRTLLCAVLGLAVGGSLIGPHLQTAAETAALFPVMVGVQLLMTVLTLAFDMQIGMSTAPPLIVSRHPADQAQALDERDRWAIAAIIVVTQELATSFSCVLSPAVRRPAWLPSGHPTAGAVAVTSRYSCSKASVPSVAVFTPV